MRTFPRIGLPLAALLLVGGCSGGGSPGPTGTLAAASTELFETQTIDFTLTLSKAAGGSGLHLPVTSSNGLILAVPTFVDVAPGAATAVFQGHGLTAGGPVTITVGIRGNPTAQAAVLPPPSITLDASSPAADQLSTGTLTITGTGSHPKAVDAAAVSVTAPAGSGVTFDAPVLTGDDTGFSIAIPYTIAVDATPGSDTVSVDANGAFLGATATFPLTVRRIPRIATLAPATATLDTTEVRPFTITLDQPARAGGETVLLTSGDANKVAVPATLVVGSGLTAAPVNLQGLGPGGPVTVGAALADGQKTAAVSVADATITAPAVTGASGFQGDTVTFTATGSGSSYVAVSATNFSLTPAMGSGLTVQSAMLTGNAAAWTLTATIAIDANAATGASDFSFDANGTTPGSVRPIAFTVLALPRMFSVGPAGTVVDAGSAATMTVTLTAPARAGGETVMLQTGDPSIVDVPATVAVSAGNTTANFQAQGVSEGDALITGTLNGTSANVSVHCRFVEIGQVVFSELVTLTADTSGNAGESIELTNVSGADQTIDGWTIQTLTSGPLSIRAATAPTDATFTLTVPAGGAVYGVPNPADPAAIPPGAAFVYGAPGTTAQMGNTGGDRLRLMSGPAALQDDVDFRAFVQDGSVVLGASDFPGSPSHSTQLDPSKLSAAMNDDGGSWCTTFRLASTMGAANQSCSTMVVNEVLYDSVGTDNGNTFAEIAGNGGGFLGGWKVLAVGTGGAATQTATIPTGRRMPADGFFVVGDTTAAGVTTVVNADLLTSSFDPANTAGQGIRLLDAAGAVVDKLQYGASPNGVNVNAEGTPAPTVPAPGDVLARDAGSSDTDDNLTDFHVVTTPSPGVANP